MVLVGGKIASESSRCVAALRLSFFGVDHGDLAAVRGVESVTKLGVKLRFNPVAAPRVVAALVL